MKNKPLVWGAVGGGILLVVAAIVYWTTPAGSLPHLMLGYLAGSPVVHFKHGLAALILAVALFVYAWFQTGPKRG